MQENLADYDVLAGVYLQGGDHWTSLVGVKISNIFHACYSKWNPWDYLALCCNKYLLQLLCNHLMNAVKDHGFLKNYLQSLRTVPPCGHYMMVTCYFVWWILIAICHHFCNKLTHPLPWFSSHFRCYKDCVWFMFEWCIFVNVLSRYQPRLES